MMGAVLCEPVSALKSLFTEKFQGNWSALEAFKQDAPVLAAHFQRVVIDFPTFSNRVFSWSEQGIADVGTRNTAP